MTKKPTIKFPDGRSIDIVDPDEIVPAYADLISELREVNGVVYISFASFIIDGEGDAGRKARVVARLRMSRDRAGVIYGFLGNMLGDPPEKASMN